jgi:hypothetical protein
VERRENHLAGKSAGKKEGSSIAEAAEQKLSDTYLSDSEPTDLLLVLTSASRKPTYKSPETRLRLLD